MTAYWVQYIYNMEGGSYSVDGSNIPVDHGPPVTFLGQSLLNQGAGVTPTHSSTNWSSLRYYGGFDGYWDSTGFHPTAQFIWNYTIGIGDYFIAGSEPDPTVLVGPTETASHAFAPSFPSGGPEVATVSWTAWAWALIGVTESTTGPIVNIASAPTVHKSPSLTQTISFPVTLSSASQNTISVNYATHDGTALAGTDYQETHGTLVFHPGQTTQTIQVPLLGTTLTHPPRESFSVVLSNATSSGSDQPVIGTGTGIGTIDQPALFTGGADVVDFNNLLPDQKAAIINGGNIYDALAGNDVVTLPNVEKADQPLDAAGKTLGWNFAHTFSAGTGDDTIKGGSGNDNIDGGDGSDTIIGSPGSDILKGGNANDTFDFKTNGFVGFGTSTTQTIDGGSNASVVASDVLLLPGSADLYSFSVNLQNNWHDTHTTVSSKLPLANVTLDTQDVEKVRFNQPTQNVADGGANTWRALGNQIIEAYSGSTTAAVSNRNWHPVSAMELGILPKDYTSSSYTFLDGTYKHTALLGNHDSIATVVSGVLNGEHTLSIAFKGTDPTDLADWLRDLSVLGSTRTIYEEFDSLTSGLIDYIAEFGDQYDKIAISGHSLGGALAQYLLDQLSSLSRVSGKLLGFTFGSIGTDGVTSGAGQHLVNLMHTTDFAQATPGGVRTGKTIFLRSSNDLPVLSHFKEGYQEDLRLLIGFANDASNLFYNDPLAVALRDRKVYGGSDLQLAIGTDTTTTILSQRNDKYVLTGGGDDRIVLEGSTLSATSGRMIDGGSGNDVLRINLFTAPVISDFVFTRDGGDFTLTYKNEFVARYHEIEEVQIGYLRFNPDGTRIAGPSAALAPRDFNGDGISDMLWRSDGGNLVSWSQNGGHVQETNSFGLIPSNWKVTGTGDFNGDSKVDLLWRSDAGTLVSWDIDNGQVLRTNDFGVVPSNWKIVGSGDFNGDARSDFLWRSDAGTLVTWNINDGQVLQTNDFGLVPSNWKIAGTGDFNGDGKSDFLFRSDAGTLVTWNIDDGRVLRTNDFGLLPSNWQVAGIGDFNGDGKSDFLFRSQAGTLVSWDIDDGRVLRTNDFGVVPSNWKIAGIGDFNGDGKSDFLWRSDAGTVATWDIDDGRVLRSHDFGVAPTDWHIV